MDKRVVSSLKHADRLWGPASLLFNGYRVLTRDTVGFKVDRWPSYSAYVKEDWSCASTRPMRFQGIGQGPLHLFNSSNQRQKLNS
jgi:hypothetical protein